MPNLTRIQCVAAGGAVTALLLSAPASASGGAAKASLSERALLRAETATIGREHALAHARARSLRRRAARRARTGSRGVRKYAAAVAVAGAKDDGGEWKLPTPLPESAIHATLLHNGKVLFWGRRPGGAEHSGSALYDPATGSTRVIEPPPIRDTNGDGTIGAGDDPANMYCSGMSLLADGRVLATGGQLKGPPKSVSIVGLKETFIFDPHTEKWTLGPSMRVARWYPTQVKLPNGDIAIVSGVDDSTDSFSIPRDFEIFRTNGPGQPDTIEHIVAGDRRFISLYPHMHLLPDSTVFMGGPDNGDLALMRLDRMGGTTAGSAWTDLFPHAGRSQYGGTSVLRPGLEEYGGSWSVLQLGGVRPPDVAGQPSPAIADVNEFDTRKRSGGWTARPALNAARFYGNTVILPDSTLIEVGGGSGDLGKGNYYWVDAANSDRLRNVEILDPGASTWRLGPAQSEWRTYHSVALLLPDGSVFSAGDDYHEGPDPNVPLASSTRQDSAEIYLPPYLFDGNARAPRAVINQSPSGVAYGQSFGISTPQAGAGERPVRRVVLMSPGSVTHAADMNQRFVPLQIEATHAGSGLNVKAPPSPAVAPPGWYMLFLIDSAGTPSIAKWVHVSGTGVAPRPGDVAGPGTTEPAVDRRRPRVALRISTASKLVRRGRVGVKVTVNERAVVNVWMRAGNKSSKVRILRFRKAGSRRIQLGMKHIRALPRGRRLPIRVHARARDAAGNLRSISRRGRVVGR